MALIKCPECGREISDRAAACPHCGCPVSSATQSEPTLEYEIYISSSLNEYDQDILADILEAADIMGRGLALSFAKQAPTVIKRGLGKDEAESVCASLSHAKIPAKIRAYKSVSTIVEASAPAATPIRSNEARCPRCHSTAIQVVKKGFSFGKATAGAILFGPVGAVAGLASDKYQRVCAACGHKF